MPEDGIIAVVPVGYFDGFSRKHSSNGTVIIDKVKCPIVGRIYMNFLSVEITHHPRRQLIKPGH
jgi:alanine racemase